MNLNTYVFNHFNLSVCAPLVILKCLFPLRSPFRLTSSPNVQSIYCTYAPFEPLHPHLEVATPTSTVCKRRRMAKSLCTSSPGIVLRGSPTAQTREQPKTKVLKVNVFFNIPNENAQGDRLPQRKFFSWVILILQLLFF